MERHNLATAPLLIEPMVDIINTIMQFGALSTDTLREVKTIRRHSLARASDIHSGEWRKSTDRTTESCCSRKRNQCQWRWWWHTVVGNGEQSKHSQTIQKGRLDVLHTHRQTGHWQQSTHNECSMCWRMCRWIRHSTGGGAQFQGKR